MLPRTLTAFVPLSGPVIKAAHAPCHATEDAITQLRDYVSRELRQARKIAKKRYQEGFNQGLDAGFADVIAKIPDFIEQQQRLLQYWLSWLRKTLEQRLPGFLITPSTLDTFLTTLSAEFEIEEATLWVPEALSQEAKKIQQHCIVKGITLLKINIHDDRYNFCLEAGPLIWVFDAKKQVVQHIIWQLGEPDPQTLN